MDAYTCTICGFTYYEQEGHDDSGIAAGTKWSDVPEDFVCPQCGAAKDMFEKI